MSDTYREAYSEGFQDCNNMWKERFDRIMEQLEELQQTNYEAYMKAVDLQDVVGYFHTSNAYANAIDILRGGKDE